MHQKSIGKTLINPSDETKWSPQRQHIGTVHLVEVRIPLEEEAQEIIHQLMFNSQDVDEVNTADLMTSSPATPGTDEETMRDNLKLSPETKRNLDVEGCKIINDLIVADKDRTIWPENTEPKFTGKKGAKLIKVAFDTKSKIYMHAYKEKEEVPVKEVIRLDFPDAHIYFCFHQTKNKYVVIDPPNR